MKEHSSEMERGDQSIPEDTGDLPADDADAANADSRSTSANQQDDTTQQQSEDPHTTTNNIKTDDTIKCATLGLAAEAETVSALDNKLEDKLAKLEGTQDWREMWNPRMSMSFTSTKGLLNGPGDNNCFLNSAVQVLWHLDVFRRNFRMLSGHSCMGASCIFCALKVIFTQFQYSDQPSLPPDALRKALAKAFAESQRFQIGVMDDAAECFENILMQIHAHIASQESEDMCQAKHCISHQKFAMTVVEQMVCECGATSEPLPFNQMVHYVSASALVNEGSHRNVQASGTHDFGALLKAACTQGDVRNCPGGRQCKGPVQIRRSLMNQPDVVSIGLIWDSDRPSLNHLKDVVTCVGTTLKLKELFHIADDTRRPRDPTLQLVGVVCYYGKHYSTFFFHSKRKRWISFDDACVKEMGSNWMAVIEKCCRGHYQPLLLLYANPDAPALCTDTAPQTTTKVKDPRLFTEESFHAGSMSRRHNNNNSIRYDQNQHQQQQPPINFETTVSRDPSATKRPLEPSAPPVETRSTAAGAAASSSGSNSQRYRRAMTPNTEIGHSQDVTVTPARRAVTPGPEWGKYHSDDDELDGPGGLSGHMSSNIAHFRQPSYLSAMDTVGLSVHEQQLQREPLYGGTSAAKEAGRPYVNQTNSSSNNSRPVDLLGSIPSYLNKYQVPWDSTPHGNQPQSSSRAYPQNAQGQVDMGQGYPQNRLQSRGVYPQNTQQQQQQQPGSGYPQDSGSYPQNGQQYGRTGQQYSGGHPQNGQQYGAGYPQNGQQFSAGYPPSAPHTRGYSQNSQSSASVAYPQNVPPTGAYPQNGQANGAYPQNGQQPSGAYPQSGQQPSGAYPQNVPTGDYPQNVQPTGGYPQNGQQPNGAYPQNGQQASEAYPQSGRQQASGAYPQNVPPTGGYPQNVPPTGAYPQNGQQASEAYPQSGRQQANGAYPQNVPPTGGYPQNGQQPNGACPQNEQQFSEGYPQNVQFNRGYPQNGQQSNGDYLPKSQQSQNQYSVSGSQYPSGYPSNSQSNDRNSYQRSVSAPDHPAAAFKNQNNYFHPGGLVEQSHPRPHRADLTHSHTAEDIVTSVNQNPLKPTVKRAQSLEELDFPTSSSSPAGSSHSRLPPPVSRTRPHSARSFDYPNGRPTVDPFTGAVKVASKARPTSAGVNKPSRMDTYPAMDYNQFNNQPSSESGDTSSISSNTSSTSSSGKAEAATVALKNKKNQDWNRAPTEDELYSTSNYINRKTVENILKHHKKPRPRTASSSGGAPESYGLTSLPHHSSSSSLDSCSETKKLDRHYSDPNAPVIKEVLKVDIPDNVSVGSQRDSGYRSGGSSGDRNSSSSNTSMESPTVDGFSRYPPMFYKALFHKPVVSASSDGHCYSSSAESSSYGQLGQGLHGLKTQPSGLGHIPENLPAITPGAAGGDSSRTAKDKGGNINTERGSAINQPDEDCQQLCLQAEALMEQSTTKEQDKDFHMALVLCTQALALFKKALGILDTSQETKVHARMKHNACVLRSRSLHRQILKRQESGQSVGSNDEQSSLNSIDPEPKDLINPDLIQLDSMEQDRMQDFKNKLNVLYKQEGVPKDGVSDAPQQVYNVQHSAPSSGLKKSATDSALFEHCNKPVKAPKPKPPVRTSSITEESRPCGSIGVSSSSSSSSESQRDGGAEEEKSANLYGTLPKKSKKPCQADSGSRQQQAEVYQSYLQTQAKAQAAAVQESSSQSTTTQGSAPIVQSKPNSDTRTSSGSSQPLKHSISVESRDSCSNHPASSGSHQPHQPNKSSLINHVRQWSKDDVKNMLMNDYCKRQNCTDKHKAVHTEQCAAQNQDVAKKRQLMYEEVLSRQVKQMQMKEEGLETNQTGRRQLPQVPPQVNSSQAQSKPTTAPPVKSKPTMASTASSQGGPPRGSGPPPYEVVIKQRPPQVTAPLFDEPNLHPNITGRRGQYDAMPPFPGSEVQKAQSALMQHMIKKSSIGEKIQAQQRAQMDMIQQQQQQQTVTHTQESPEVGYWQNAPQKHDLRKTSSQGQLTSYSNNGEEFRGSNAPVGVENRNQCATPELTDSEDFPPPPPPICEADFIQPNSEPAAPAYSHPPSDCSLTSGQYNVRTAAAAGLSAQSVIASKAEKDPTVSASDRSKPCLSTFQPLPPQDSSSEPPSQATPPTGPALRPLPASHLTPAKSALSKRKKKKGRKSRRRVTFSDNIALIVDQEEAGSEIDYMAYVSQILSKKTPPPLVPSVPNSDASMLPVKIEPKSTTGYDSDFDDDTSDSGSSTEQTGSERVRCSLCRKKLIEATSIYCEDCSFYMSKFQPQCAS